MFDFASPSSSRKKAHSRKSSISPSSPVQVSYSPNGTLAVGSSFISPAPPKVKKHVMNFNKVGKELYFISKVVLRGRVIHPKVCTYPVVAQLCDKLAFQGWINLFLILRPQCLSMR